jgi:hypothetical protein
LAESKNVHNKNPAQTRSLYATYTLEYLVVILSSRNVIKPNTFFESNKRWYASNKRVVVLMNSAAIWINMINYILWPHAHNNAPQSQYASLSSLQRVAFTMVWILLLRFFKMVSYTFLMTRTNLIFI